ncbi:Ubr1 [Symbiodinium sp. CCMP2456]|nr:Ubr1 [Symbiodinium sp. CCMP2456]
MGWQNLSSSLRRWDTSSKAVGEVEAAAEELLASGNDAEALQLFSEALDPSLQRGTDFLKRLAQTEGAKCRCDAVWYGDTIAYGCKTCGLSSASCICVFCFDAGDHEGHDFYISRSDYGCCDCGDAYAWRQTGFCRHHPGPREDSDPAQLLPEATRRRAQLLIPAQVRRLVNFHPSVLPGVEPPPVPSEPRRTRSAYSSSKGTSTGSQSRATDEDSLRVLITGINLRVTEEQLREFLESKLRNAEVATLQNLELQRDEDSKASKGRAYINMASKAGVTAIINASGEVLRGSPLRMHVGPSAIAEAEKHLQALETNFEWLLNLGGFHDGLRKIIGQVFLDRRLFVQGQSAVEVLLRHSHLMEPSVRKLETNLMVDLMLDLDFKHRFAQVFTTLYPELVRNREGNQDTNELGDFTCQIFTRQDVTMELVRDRDLVKTLLECLWGLLRPALVSDSAPAVFNHESTIFRDHEIIQCSMDLLYVLDHSDIAREIIRSPRLSGELWAGWIQILISMQAMNPHKRRSVNHVEFTSPSWGNALTLHTDLGSNTWLILDAIEFKAELESVKDMAQLAWRELRSWMVQVHAAEGRVGAAAMEGAFDYEVSRGTSFHIPVNRVLALLLHQLCIRAPRARSDGSLVEQVFSAVGMSAESDIIWWMEHPLRALVLHWQVMAGMWRRNGEALEHESEFYRMNYWHHLLIDVDLLVMRMAALALRPETFFQVTLKRFELGHWLLAGDPMGRLLLREEPEQEFAMMKLQSFVLFLYQLLSWNSHLSLTWPQLVTHTTRQFLSVGPKSHSQLWDPRLERSTATATAKDQHMLEAALREISSFSEADGSGHNPAKYHLREDQWFAVDPYYHLFAWSEQQKVEENLVAAMKARGGDLSTWIEESARLQPPLREAFRRPFLRFCGSGMVQAFCWLLLVRLAFQKDVSSDGRLLVLALLLAIRSTSADGLEEIPPCGWSDVDMEVSSIPTEEVQLTWLAKAVTPLSRTATRKFCVQVTTAGAAKAELNVSLMDAVDRLVAMGGSVSSSLARGLRQRLQREAVPSSESACHGDEDRKAKRRKAAERQQRMLENLRKRQAAFISGAGRDLLETDTKSQEEQNGMDAEAGLAGMETSPAECVVCMSHQEGEDSENPLGLICFLRPAVASSLPRSRVPTEQAVLLQQPKTPVCGPPRRPQCFEAQAPDGLVLARACSHRMHFSCWRSFRPASLRSGGDRISCPYCGTVANALLPVADIGESARFRLPLRAAGAADEAVDFPIPRRHADASDDFLACLEGQLRRLGQQHTQAACLPEALGAAPGVAGPMMSLSKLCADSIALAEVRLRTRPAAAAVGADSSASASATSSASRRTLDGSETSAAASMLRGIIAEAIDATPPLTQVLGGKLATFLLSTTPHGRFQTLTALLLCLCKNRACQPSERGRARQLVHGFYLLEAVVVLSCLCDDALIEAGFHQASGHAAESESIWSLVQTLASTGQGADQSMRLTPIRTLAEAAKVLKLALNPFLFKVRMLLYLLSPDNFPSTEAIFTKSGMEVLPPAEDHSRLASGEDGLPEVEELLMLRPQNCRVDIAALTSLIGCIPPESLHRGLQPRSPLLLVLVDDAEIAEAPMHVWQVSSAGFSRLQASGCEEFVELSPNTFPANVTGRLYCVAYRLSLPVITGKVYQKFYTQFVHARCPVCTTTSSIPTLCLLCGTFLCCNSECCRREGEGGQMMGEVTQHAQVCGFGTCIFLQLSNSLVHIVSDGLITCWGSLYLDGHGEEEYNLSRPLYISELRLQQLTQLVREAAFDFESRLKWKKVIFVPLAGFSSRAWDVIGTNVLARCEQPDGRCPPSLGSVNKCWQAQTVNAVARGLCVLACVPSKHAQSLATTIATSLSNYVLFRCSSVALANPSHGRGKLQ